jgi:hypothetical protein
MRDIRARGDAVPFRSVPVAVVKNGLPLFGRKTKECEGDDTAAYFKFFATLVNIGVEFISLACVKFR